VPEEGSPHTEVHVPETYREIDVFALLLWRFAYPNGGSSVIGEMYDEGGDPDGPFKWEFNFVTDDGLRVRVIRTWLALELMVAGRAVPAQDVLAFLDHNLSIHSKEVAEAIGRLEHHRLLINPYVRHRRMSEFARHELLAQNVPEVWYPSSLIASRADMERHVKSIQDHGRAASRETFFSVTLVSESAVMAEAFLNLLLAVSLQKVIRENKELFEETLRRTWRAKIQHLPLTSTVVKKAPDMGDARVRDAGKLFALRNRIAHSYPDPDHLGTGVMYWLDAATVGAELTGPMNVHA
jgi:hypothetical protein